MEAPQDRHNLTGLPTHYSLRVKALLVCVIPFLNPVKTGE